jgi:hypothetical protein
LRIINFRIFFKNSYYFVIVTWPQRLLNRKLSTGTAKGNKGATAQRRNGARAQTSFTINFAEASLVNEGY